MNIDPKLVEQWCKDWADSDEAFQSDYIAQRAADYALDKAIAVITNYQIPFGNSAAGEIACDMTYAALVEICAAIRALEG
jgi:hypothetical protein